MPFVTGTTKSKGHVKIPGSKGPTSTTPPKSAKSKSGARKFAEENIVTETLPSGKTVRGQAGTAADVAKAKRNRHEIERITGVLTELPYAPKVAGKPGNKDWRNVQSHAFRTEALKAVAETHLKLDDEGNVETKTQKIPRIKTSPKAIKAATKQLNQEIDNARAKGVGKREAAIARAVGTRAIVKRNYVTDKQGNIQYKTIQIPKLRTDPKTLRRDLHRVNKQTKEIKRGKRRYFPTMHNDADEHTILGDLIHAGSSVVHDATNIALPTSGASGSKTVNLADETGSGISDAAKTASNVVFAIHRGVALQQAQQDAQYRAAGLGFIPNVRTKAMHGIRTGILFGSEYLTRPGLAVEAQIARELSKPGSPIGELLLSDRARKKLSKGASPGEVLLHGHGAKNAISGGDLTEAIFGMPQLGLGVDLLTDPFMYIGAAGLPAKFAERTAAITDRLAREAPEVLKDVKFVRLMEGANKSGDFEMVTKYLEDAAREKGVSLKRLGKTKTDKAAIAEVNRATVERAREISDLIRKGREESPTIKGKSIHVPGEASQRAAEEIAKFGLRRALKPGFTLELRTPLGRKLGGIEVPVPRKLAEKRLFLRPSAMSTALGREPESSKLLEMARSSEANAHIYREAASEHEGLLNKVADLEANPTTKRETLRAAESDLAHFEDNLRAKMMDARRANAGSASMASMNEIFRGHNAKRFSHEIYRATNALGRQTQRVFFHNVMQALKPVMKDRQARLRIGAHMAAEADTGTRAIVDAVAPLTVKEQKVMDDLRNIYTELEKYGLETGTLKNVVENYIPRYWSTADNISGPLHAGPRSEEAAPLGGKRGAASAFQQHRTMAEMAAIADKQKLAQMIRNIATKPVTTKQSLDLAEQWFKNSKIRFAMEDMAQAVNRGHILKEDALTDLQKAAYEWSGNMVSDDQAVPRLFQDLEVTEGVLKLHPEAYKYHNFVEDPFVGLSTRDEYRAKLFSAFESEARILEAMKDVKVGSALHNHYRDLLKQRKEEIADILKTKPKEAPDRAVTPVTDGAEAPTAEMVGLPSDREIEGFLPNASEEYIGTLKDFRRDHPDMFPVLDPMLSNYHRTRAEGLQTVYRTRWRSMDKSVGRSAAEARASRFILADGRSGYTSEIKPLFGEGMHDKPIGYAFKESGEEIDLADIEFPGRTLIPNKEYKIWYDPATGREYALATDLDAAVGGAITDAVGPDRLWPTDVIRDARAEFFRMGETGMTDLYDSGIENLAQRTLTMIRYGVTTLFPAFHFRNMISDTLLSTLADPGFLFHPVSNSKLTWSVLNRGGKVKVKNGVEFGVDYVKVPGLGKMKPEDYLGIMDSFGLRSNQHIAEMARLAERGDIPDLEKWWQGIHSYRRPLQTVKGGFGLGPSGAVGRRAVEASARREDIMRIITFTQRMRRNKGDFADAMWWTIKHHFDYGDLTMFERRWMRNLFLFYTWYRKNIPLQFMSIITRPGFFSGMTNAYIDLAEGETPLNFNWSKINPILPDMSGPVPNSGLVPDYMFTQLSAPSMNWNGHALAIGFGAPWSDMNLIGHFLEDPGEGTRQLLAMFNPGVSLPFQFAFQKDLLTGRTFDKREASGSASMLNFLAEKFGFDPLQKDENGNPVLPWQLNLAFNQLPIGGRLTGYFRDTPITEDPGRLNKWFGGGAGSFITGFNAYVSPKEGERLDAAYISRVIGRAAQRSSLSSEGGTDKDLAEFDRQTIEWAKQLGIPHKYLEVVPGIGPAYVTQEEREGFKLGSGGSPLTGGSSGQLKGLLGGEGKPNFDAPPKEYGSQTEESLEKLLHPGKFGEQRALQPLGMSFVPLGGSDRPENSLETGADVAGTGPLNTALSRLRANAAARKEGEEAKVTPKRNKNYRPLTPKAQAHAAQKSINSDAKKVKLSKQSKNEIETGLPGEATEFARWLSKFTGLNKDFVEAWVRTEGGGHANGGEAGKNNWLGVGYPGRRTAFSESSYFNGNAKSAAKATADWMMGKIGKEFNYGAAQGIREIIPKAKGKSAEAAAKALEESGWGTNVNNLRSNIGNAPVSYTKVKADAAGMLQWARATVGTDEGTKLQAKWAAESGISSAEAWCSAWIAAGLARHGLPMPSNPAYSGSWAEGWKGGKVVGSDIANAKPGDILVFSGQHVGLYVGGGEMISGNFGDTVARGPISEESAPLSAVVRPHYKGGWVKVPDAPAAMAYSNSSGSPSAYGVAGGQAAKMSPEQREKSVQNMRKRMSAAGGGSGVSSSIGNGAFLTTTEAYNLGNGAAIEGEDILNAVKKALERQTPPPRAKTPKFNVKSARL